MRIGRVALARGEETRIMAGHPWVYDNEVASVEGGPGPGDIVDVESSRKRYLGRGFYNPASKIRVRLATKSKEGIDRGFWKRRIDEAAAFRSSFLDTERDSHRLLFAEADRAPGLIVDVYNAARGRTGEGAKVAVYQLLSAGADARRADIREALADRLGGAFLIERSDAQVRALEGLAGEVRSADPGCPGELVIEENGVLMRVDFRAGHKTGHYLDQRDNRAAAAPYARGKKVLDAFCNTGGFGIVALKAGARSVEFVDSSEDALDGVRANLGLNGLGGGEGTRAVKANVFDYLKEAERDGRRFGLVVLDPPPFARDRESEESAFRGYKEINMRALSVLEEGGWLVSSSCSHRFGPEKFLSMLREAARDSGVRLRAAETRYQSKDHPVLLGYPESLYLTCVIAQAV
jgi:23S rRNA (cytosine1962-C5)-methyltransferase